MVDSEYGPPGHAETASAVRGTTLARDGWLRLTHGGRRRRNQILREQQRWTRVVAGWGLDPTDHPSEVTASEQRAQSAIERDRLSSEVRGLLAGNKGHESGDLPRFPQRRSIVRACTQARRSESA